MRMRHWIGLALAACLLASSPAAAQYVHEIDAELDAAMEEALTTADQMEVIGRAIEKWDALLNANYGDLRNELPADAFAGLRDAQRAWNAFREKEHAALTTAFDAMAGTMYRPMHAMQRMTLVKHRALELGDLLETWRLSNQ